MSRFSPYAPITVLTYASGSRVNGILLDMCGHLVCEGYALAGLVQTAKSRPGRSRCDMVLEDLGSGQQIEISDDRGPLARGCILAISQLIHALEVAARSLDDNCDLLVVNKFGKTEAEGGGLRPLIVDAMARGVPVLIAVPVSNLESWRHFAQGLAVEFDVQTLFADPVAACRQLGLQHNSQPLQTVAPLGV